MSKKYYIALDDYEHRVIINYLNEMNIPPSKSRLSGR